MKNIIISCNNLTKTYPCYGYVTAGFKNFILKLPKVLKEIKKRFIALENISFEVYKGECFGIIGRNGAGKSTLLGLIAGVIKPDKGYIKINGKVSPLLELGAGFHPDLTGKGNIVLNGILLGMTKKEVLKKMDEIIDFAELQEFIHQPVRTFSSGMLARLGFAIVAHLDPEILLIDEVLAVGDIKFQQKCINKILDFRNKGVTIILVSHNMKDIKRLCDRAMWIENHKIKTIDSPSNIVKKYMKEMET